MIAGGRQRDAGSAETEPRYRPISDYGVIGDCHTAALIGSNGSIDWCCLPRFDAPAVFCRILDADRGGYFQIAPVGPARARQRYRPRTAILETDFETPAGAVRLIDLMPVTARRVPVTSDPRDPEVEFSYPYRVRVRHEILRRVTGLRGDVRVRLTLWPTFDFGRQRAAIEVLGRSALISGDGEYLALAGSADLSATPDAAIVAEWTVRAGESFDFVLTHERTRGTALDELYAPNADRLIADTETFWTEWTGRMQYTGPYQSIVERSALTLKLLTYEPTGAIVAAPTTSLPEEIGGVRNWDYRFAWLRDASFTLYALFVLGYVGEATDFFHWLESIPQSAARPLQVLYGIDGRAHLPEVTLDHLEGYQRSAPVRIGNGAVDQRQLDVYGVILDSAYLYDKAGGAIDPNLWEFLARLADAARENWRLPDNGIWEVREGQRQFVYSKVLCWVALERAIRLAGRRGLPGHRAGWRGARDAVRRAILREGYDAQIGAFVQSFGSRQLDASALLFPLVGFISPADPRMVSTVDRIRKHLVQDGLVYRYWGVDDGLPGGEGTFAICTSWLVDNLALQGRVEEADDLFCGLIRHLSPLGLLAEEIDPIGGRQLGNFPQAFSHIGLINNAINLHRAAAARQPRT